MNSCVNTRSKEFKNLCSKYDVSSEKMELLIHQYWNDRNSDTEYPSDAYIEAHLGKSPYQESIDSVVKIWEKDYSKSKIFNSNKELKEAQNKAARFFPSEAIVSYTNNQGKYVLTIRKPVKNIKEAYRKAIENGSWNNDKKTNNNQDIEDIQMYISSNEDKSSNKTYFTFKDGTQVKAPFVVNIQQEAALNALDNFVKSNANVITLSGYAGTGKTSIMQIFKEKMDKEGVPVTFTAATNKAANVLKTKVKDAQTLHSAFGIQAGVDYNSEYDLKHLINTVKENDLLPGSVVVIDEASMIDDNIYKILNKIALDQNLKIIYLGDKAQLAPVNSAQISPIFRNKEGKVLELTKVERTGDNAILKEATDLRTKGVFSYVSSFNRDGKGVAFINPSKNRKEIENIIKAFTAKIQNDPDYFRILAYRNNTISKYNDYVRKILGYDIKNNPNDYYPHENEPIVGYNNWGYLKTRKGHTYRFINSESYRTIDATAPITNIELSVPNGKVYTITAKPVVVQKTDGTEDTLNFIDVRGNQDNRKAVTEIANVISYLWRKRKTVPFSEQSKILQEINKLQTALFVNDNIEENGRTIVQKIWDFGYAMTVHKSQGSTFKNVIIDDKDIQSARKNSEGIGYVDLGDSQEETVSKDQMDAILSSQEESIDSDITAAILTDQGEEVSSMPTKVKETKKVDINDTMDTVRQLEYVAVSRATDTATVITDMAKVEDSPLNHEANQFSKADEHKSSVNPKDNTTNPVIQRSDNEITKQVVSHLKSIPGIKVFGRNAMEEFLKTHNIAGLQQMIDNNSQINKKDYNNEEQSIIDKAKKNGTFMKAPNGKPTNLTERQWVLVRTKAFKNWFGDWENDPANASKVVDENGEPLVVYHRTKEIDIPIFDRKKVQHYGFWFSVDKDYYTKNKSNRSNFNTIAAFLNIRTPNIISHRDFGNAVDGSEEQNLDNTKYDGWITKDFFEAESPDDWDYAMEMQEQGIDIDKKVFVMATNPNQIKSATNNIGTFSRTDDDITTFTTPQGEVYGFVDKDGNIYLDETKISPEHPIYEAILKAAKEKFEKKNINKQSSQNNQQTPAKDSKLYKTTVSSYSGDITPDANTIFVFGSNPEGRHGAGAARIAREKFGAIYGQGEGLQGNAYALPTKDLRIKKNNGLKSISPEQIIENIKKLYETARQNPDKQFKVAYRNTDKASLNGYTGLEMIDMFLKAGPIPNNIVFSKEWVDTGKFNLSKTTLNFKPEEAEFYSGAAVGSDKAWEAAATEAGIKVKNYTVKDWDKLSNEWKEKLDKEYKEIVAILGRRVLDINSYSGKLVRRDMMQADKADAIFAIGTLASNGYVDGGTGYASTRGILRNIPVYLFDQKDSTWKVWDKTAKKFVPTSQPALTKNAAVIGTRELQENGKKAINDIFTVHTSQDQTDSIENKVL